MIHYGAGEDVHTAIAAFAAAHPVRGWLCRHWEVPPGTDPEQACEQLVAAFRRRFGQAPTLSGLEAS